MHEILTVSEFSTKYRIARATAYRLINIEGFPVIKIGARRKVIPEAAALEWFERHAGISICGQRKKGA